VLLPFDSPSFIVLLKICKGGGLGEGASRHFRRYEGLEPPHTPALDLPRVIGTVILLAAQWVWGLYWRVAATAATTTGRPGPAYRRWHAGPRHRGGTAGSALLGLGVTAPTPAASTTTPEMLNCSYLYQSFPLFSFFFFFYFGLN
jgi:hypothetical protein